MSGILLPGQDKEPKSEAKIELPSGYSSAARDRKRVVENDQAAPEALASSSQPDGGPVDSPDGMPELLFPPRAAQVKCPSCGATYTVPVFSIVDLGANPELRAPLLSGQINVALCPTCGAGGPLAVPFLVHDAEHEFLGVYAPMEGRNDDLRQQKEIGELTRSLMTKIPAESRKGYLLQPRSYIELERLMERLWEFEGVTPEMLRRQREQSNLLRQLITLADDDKALDIVLERSKGLVDRDFFTMLDQILLMSRTQAQNGELDSLQTLRTKLLDRTEAGREIRRQQDRVRSLLAQITDKATREDVLEIVIDAWQEEDGEQMVGTLALATGIASDYEFLMLLSQQIDEEGDAGARTQLEELRSFLVGIQEQVTSRQQEVQQSVLAEAQQLLQEVLQESDTEAALRGRADQIDEAFLAVLAETIRAAEQNKATAAVRRLTRVYEQAIGILQEQMPEDMRLINQLLMAPDDAAARHLLRENRNLVTREFLANIDELARQMRASDRAEVADRLKSLRGQVALML